MVTLSIIIVLYNEFALIEKCITSIKKQGIKNTEIIVVDNASEPNGYAKIKKKYPWIRFIHNATNLGSAKAVNIGFKKVQGKYVLILTPDTFLLPNTIMPTLRHMEKHTNVGIVGCRVYSYPKHFHVSAFHTFPNLYSHLWEYNMLVYKVIRKMFPLYHPLFYTKADHTRLLHPKHIIGAYLLIRKAAWDSVGGFHKDYHMYREETDLCKRVVDNGWDIVYLPVGGLVHIGGTPWRKAKIAQESEEYLKSTYIFMCKHYGKIYTITTYILTILSVATSIPFVAGVGVLKHGMGKSSQSYDYWKSWVSILRWHVSKGIIFLTNI